MSRQDARLEQYKEGRLIIDHRPGLLPMKGQLWQQPVKHAVKVLERVVEIRERIVAEDHRHRLVSQYVRARAYLDDEQIERAVEKIKHVVAVEAEILAEDDASRQLSKDLLQRCYERLDGAILVVESEASVPDMET